MTCNAAVYPGVTSYGPSFEAVHDAQIESLNRDIHAVTYREQMREIVLKQSGSELQSDIEKNGENFDALALTVSGNPRLLLKTVALAGRLRSSDVQGVLKDFPDQQDDSAYRVAGSPSEPPDCEHVASKQEVGHGAEQGSVPEGAVDAGVLRSIRLGAAV
jgi:hypothetical protein